MLNLFDEKIESRQTLLQEEPLTEGVPAVVAVLALVLTSCVTE